MKESTTYQAILDEGEARGETKWRLTQARRLLRLLGDDSFGTPDEPTIRLLDTLSDLAQVEQLFLRLPHCQSWEELLKDYSPPRPTRRRKK